MCNVKEKSALIFFMTGDVCLHHKRRHPVGLRCHEYWTMVSEIVVLDYILM